MTAGKGWGLSPWVGRQQVQFLAIDLAICEQGGVRTLGNMLDLSGQVG
jgi:hypothetical protein